MNIGKIISVEFDKFRIKMYQKTKTSTASIDGKVYYFGNIGSYLKVKNPIGDSIICEVVAVLDQSSESRQYSAYNLDSSRELVIKPIGTLHKDSSFSMGVGIFPSIYSDIYIVTSDDIETILSTFSVNEEAEDNIHHEIEIGVSKNMINYKIDLSINKLFNIHSAVLGNSGSGKSNTIAHILQQIFRKEKYYANGANMILFDVNGEYPSAFIKELNENVNLKCYKPNSTDKPYTKFYLPYYLLTLDEWLGFLLASERTQKPFWDNVLQECYKFYSALNNDDAHNRSKFLNYLKWKFRNILANLLSQGDSDTSKVTAARGIVIKCKEIVAENEFDELNEFLEELEGSCNIKFGDNKGELEAYLTSIEIDEELAVQTNSIRLRSGDFYDYKFLKVAVDLVLLDHESKGNYRIREFTSTMLSRLDYFLNNPDCDFMRSCPDVYTSSQDYLNRIFDIDGVLDQQLTIVDSSEVGNDALELMTSVIGRMIYDNRKRKSGKDRIKQPIHLILDEAHRYIKKDEDYILKQNIFERIAREGRKFSLFLIVSSQRPSELSPTVLSQCGNYIIHRIQNEVDMKFIYSVLPYFSSDFTSKIKQQIPGEALIFGNCVPMPLHVKVNEAIPPPDSKNCDISSEWFVKIEEPEVKIVESSEEEE